jgi:L-Ala-D/L-Glu epimerase
MPIVELTAWRVLLPLKRRVTHASAERDSSENLVVCCRLDDGILGYGEGVPRPYVTGETPEGALAAFAATDWAGQLAGHEPTGWSDAIALCRRIAPAIEGNDPRGIAGNALRAAVELSVLDAWGQRFREPVSAATRHVAEAAAIAARHERVRYSAAITAEGPWRERISALKIRLYGFAQCKVKVGMAGADDAARLRRIRGIVGSAMDLRVDANEAWPAGEAAARIGALAPARITCV